MFGSLYFQIGSLRETVGKLDSFTNQRSLFKEEIQVRSGNLVKL